MANRDAKSTQKPLEARGQGEIGPIGQNPHDRIEEKMRKYAEVERDRFDPTRPLLRYALTFPC